MPCPECTPVYWTRLQWNTMNKYGLRLLSWGSPISISNVSDDFSTYITYALLSFSQDSIIFNILRGNPRFHNLVSTSSSNILSSSGIDKQNVKWKNESCGRGWTLINPHPHPWQNVTSLDMPSLRLLGWSVLWVDLCNIVQHHPVNLLVNKRDGDLCVLYTTVHVHHLHHWLFIHQSMIVVSELRNTKVKLEVLENTESIVYSLKTAVSSSYIHV
jgi:hypothetical protein